MKPKHNLYIVRTLIRYFKALEVKPSDDEINNAWENIVREGNREMSIIRQRCIYRTIVSLSITACLALVFLFRVDSIEEEQPDISAMMANLPEATVLGDSIRLIVSDSKIVTLKKGSTIVYTSQGTVSVDKEEIATKGKSEFNQIIVPKGKYAQLTLSDGSYLHINAGTKVVYPPVFTENKREIFVDGEIYIDVKHNETAPFFVRTEKFSVRVLGTAFNVNAYSNSALSEVVLLRGKVNVEDKQKGKMQLQPNQLVSLKNGVIEEKHKVNAIDYIAWTKGQLIINAEPIKYVLQRLEYYYGIEIVSEPSVREFIISGSLDLNCPLEEVLKRLSITTSIEYKATPSGFYVKKR